jgi:ferredoxin
MKLRLDVDVCTGHGRCYALAPDVFGADEYGHCELIVEGHLEGALLKQAIAGVQACPEQALGFDDDEFDDD